MPRITVLLAAVVMLALLALGRLPGIGAQDGTPVATAGGFVGTWRVTPVIEGQATAALTTFNADGTVLTSNPPVQAAPPDLGAGVLVQSVGHGEWAATGERTADVTFVFVQSDGNGNYLGTRTTRGSLELDDDGETWTGTFDATVADAAGSVLFTAAGTVEATRIAVEPATPSTVEGTIEAAETVLGGTPAPGTPPGDATSADQAIVEVTGLVEQPLRLTLAELQAIGSRRVEVTWQTEDDRTETHVFRGVPLQAVLAQAGPRFGPERDARVSSYVVATGRDGYQAVVAWGEFAPLLGGEPVILAWEQDGRPLARERRPIQLIVPGDSRFHRAVWGVARIELRSVDDPSGATPTA